MIDGGDVVDVHCFVDAQADVSKLFQHFDLPIIEGGLEGTEGTGGVEGAEGLERLTFYFGLVCCF